MNTLTTSLRVAVVLAFVSSSEARADGVFCAKPITIADAWQDVNQNGIYDPGVDVYDPSITGYSSADLGVMLVIHQGTSFTATPTVFFPVAFPALNRGTPLTGVDPYQYWLLACSPFSLEVADTFLLEPQIAPHFTISALDSLIAQDPTAAWDDSTDTVVGSQFATSPRLVTILGFDPNYFPAAGRNNIILSKFMWVFIEGVAINTIQLRIVDATTDEPLPVERITWGNLKNRYQTTR